MKKPIIIGVFVLVVLVIWFATQKKDQESPSVEDRLTGKGNRTRPNPPEAKPIEAPSAKMAPPSGGKTERIRMAIGEVKAGMNLQARRDIKEPVKVFSHPDEARQQLIRVVQLGEFLGHATGKTFEEKGVTWVEFTDQPRSRLNRDQPLRYAPKLFIVKS